MRALALRQSKEDEAVTSGGCGPSVEGHGIDLGEGERREWGRQGHTPRFEGNQGKLK